jgi:hypothetical protein
MAAKRKVGKTAPGRQVNVWGADRWNRKVAKTHLGRPAVYLSPDGLPWCVEVETEWGILLKQAIRSGARKGDVRYRILRTGSRDRGELMSAAEAQAELDRRDANTPTHLGALRPRVGDYVAFLLDGGTVCYRGSVIEIKRMVAYVLLDESCGPDPEADANGRVRSVLLDGILILSRPDWEGAA